MGLAKRIWGERIARQSLQAAAVFGASMSLIYLLPEDRVVLESKELASIQENGERPAGGLSVNGTAIPYQDVAAVSLESLADSSGDYRVEFIRTEEHPAVQIEYRYLGGDGSPVTLQEDFEGAEYESREIVLGGDTMIESIGIWSGDVAYEVRFE